MSNPTSETPNPLPSKLEKLLSHLVSCREVTDTVHNHAKVLEGLRNPHKASCCTNGRGNKENTHPVLALSQMLNTPAPTLRGSHMSHESPSPAARGVKRSFSQTDIARDAASAVTQSFTTTTPSSPQDVNAATKHVKELLVTIGPFLNVPAE